MTKTDNQARFFLGARSDQDDQKTLAWKSFKANDDLHTFLEVGVVCDCSNHVILSTRMTRHPSPDVFFAVNGHVPAAHRVKIATLLADAGYNSEATHVFVRETYIELHRNTTTDTGGYPRIHHVAVYDDGSRSGNQ